jgi:hypothetical protein
MTPGVDSKVIQLASYNVERGKSSISGLSSGAFMTVQLHLAHSSSFVGAGVIAGGPFRCAESFRAAAFLAEDAYVQNALYICMNPLVPQTAPNAERLAQVARATAAAGEIDSIEHLAHQRVYIFTGSKDEVVYSCPTRCARRRPLGSRRAVAAAARCRCLAATAGHSSGRAAALAKISRGLVRGLCGARAGICAVQTCQHAV